MAGLIVDTSSILFALSNNIDIFNEAEVRLGLNPIISRGILRELKSKASGRGKQRAYASAALELIKRHGVKIEPDAGYVDKWILDSALRFSCVCTNDSKLRAALRAKGADVRTMSRSGDFR